MTEVCDGQRTGRLNMSITKVDRATWLRLFETEILRLRNKGLTETRARREAVRHMSHSFVIDQPDPQKDYDDEKLGLAD